MSFPDETPTLIEEGEALCARLAKRQGHRVVSALVERVKDLEFQHAALGFLQGVAQELVTRIQRQEAYVAAMDADIASMVVTRATLLADMQRP